MKSQQNANSPQYYKRYIQKVDELITSANAELAKLYIRKAACAELVNKSVAPTINNLKVTRDSLKANYEDLGKEATDKRIEYCNNILKHYPVSERTPVEGISVVNMITTDNNLIEDFKDIIGEIENTKATIAKYKTYKVKSTTFNKALNIYDDLAIKLLLSGKRLAIGVMGYVQIINVTRKEGTVKKLNFAASKKYKQSLIDAGEELYNKNEELRCKEAGIPYKGKDWRIYDYSDQYFYADWTCHLKGAREYYSYCVTRTDNNNMLIEDMNKQINEPNDVFKFKLGIIKCVLRLNDNFSDYIMFFKSKSN